MVAFDEQHLARLRGFANLLRDLDPATRFLRFKELCEANGGHWGIPENPAAYCPCFFEASLLGIYADSDDPMELPAKWVKHADRAQLEQAA